MSDMETFRQPRTATMRQCAAMTRDDLLRELFEITDSEARAHLRKVFPILRMVILGVWLVLIIPWFWFAPLSFMAFDGGDNIHARLFVLSVCTYPIFVIVTVLLRKRSAWTLLFPCISLAGILASGSY
jgi:hypothetical protein